MKLNKGKKVKSETKTNRKDRRKSMIRIFEFADGVFHLPEEANGDINHESCRYGRIISSDIDKEMAFVGFYFGGEKPSPTRIPFASGIYFFEELIWDNFVYHCPFCGKNNIHNEDSVGNECDHCPGCPEGGW